MKKINNELLERIAGKSHTINDLNMQLINQTKLEKDYQSYKRDSKIYKGLYERLNKEIEKYKTQ